MTESSKELSNTAQLDEKWPLSVEVGRIPFINLALQQNSFPVIREIILTNHAGHDLEGLECLFSSSTEFIQETIIDVKILKQDEALSIHDIALEFNYQLLANLSDAMKGNITLDIRQNGQLLYHQDMEVTAFAPDQWLGPDVIPELICAFVTPNLSVINQLLPIISDELEAATGSSSLNGYTEGKHRVYEICKAIYRAIHTWGIRYALPESSFGMPGQRIRFADSIYKYRVGTCLDTTILFASVMEQCNLHPVILLQKNHAYIGCHLVERYFPDLPLDNLQTIRKLVDLDEFVVIETTMVTQQATFTNAETVARSEHLNIDDDFLMAIDVIRARFSGVRPLPLRQSTQGMEFQPVERKVKVLEDENQRSMRQEVDLSKLDETKLRSGRIARWTQKLLDLSLRNRLLNLRNTQYVIPLICPDITILEDMLAANATITLASLVGQLGEKEIHDLSMLRNNDITSDLKNLLDNELKQKRLCSYLPPNDMSRRLTALYRQGKTDIEEGGVNTLFLGIGFLEWKPTPRDTKSYMAPILLLPIRLVRKSIVEGIKIIRLDEDTIINETLLELLRSQYHLSVPGLSPLPTDSSGVDVGMVMQIFRQTIKDMPGWEVREEACIGLFSFGKFVMWTDMVARMENLKQHPLVKHLIEGGGLFDDGIATFPPDEIGHHLDIKRLYCPMSADSSQLAAVLYSTMGKSFVLHGPPGTGKSQTITNIIAQNLALGRRVLFVSEKKAALDVVHKRLESVGLRPFCLELHSNKSGKTEVLAQFSEALNVPETPEPQQQWEQVTNELQRLREELTDYVTDLHHKYPNGLSAYDCFARLMDAQQPPDKLLEMDCTTQTADEYSRTIQLVSDLANAFARVDSSGSMSLSWLSPNEWSPVYEHDMVNAAQNLQEAISSLTSVYHKHCSELDLEAKPEIQSIYNIARLVQTLKGIPFIPGSILDENFADNFSFLSSFSQVASKIVELKPKMKNYNLDMVQKLDITGIEERIRQNNSSFILTKMFKDNALLKELAGLKTTIGSKFTIQELSGMLPVFSQWNETAPRYEKMLDRAKSLLGDLWQEDETDWTKLEPVFDSVKKILEIVHDITRNDNEATSKCLQRLRNILPKNAQEYTDWKSKFENQALALAWNHFQEALQLFEPFAHSIQSESNLDNISYKLGKLLNNTPSLRNILRYNPLRQEANNCGLKAFADALENHALSAQSASDVFELAYAARMLGIVLSKSKILAQFNGLNHQQRIQRFRELDDDYIRLSRKLIFAKLAAALPRRRSGPCPEGTELGLLKRECEKKARQKPVRQLLTEIPTLAATLKPCFLMSPLSVAQYLPIDSALFDLVVFDEASQIPVWDAIGVIARGRQLIVVGDPRQMPPTNFFQKGDNAEDENGEDTFEDMESILDECLAAGVFSCYLNWHYRSRHESLIAFSNHYYYKDKLFTFPTASFSERLGVHFHFVPYGIYDRRMTRTNTKEADALVKYVFNQLENSHGKRRSFGIVTFSEAQKNLIEDKMEAERSKHPGLESYFSDQNDEPLFVKNLENVQGDERDVILFSIGYAPDAEGNFSMNFGPLNRQGGERRLNVAITRAKEQVVVFSSIHANQIDLSRTSAVGAAHLKYFLDYAEKDVRIQPSIALDTRNDELPSMVADFLKEKGFSIERNVGCSGYRIDLAIRDPQKKDAFLLGIECDGPEYASQKTTRDRDHIRYGILKSLGWKIFRIWSVDWMYDRPQVQAALLAEIEKAKTELPITESAPEEPEEDNLPNDNQTDVHIEEPQSQTSNENTQNRKAYIACHLVCNMEQDQFYWESSRQFIRNQFIQVIQKEAPIYEHLLKKRVMRAWNFTRSGDYIQSIMNECLPTGHPVTKFGEDNVYWNIGQNPAQYTEYRTSSPDDPDKRAIDDIPIEELANAMVEILTDFTSCEQGTLFRETVKLFGLSVVTQKARKYLMFALEALRKSGKV